MNRLKEEKGSLALFVTIAMLFFMAFLLVLYTATANEQKTQLEITSRIKQTYEKDLTRQDEVYTSLLGTSEYIPIYTAEQFKKIGSGESVYIAETGKNYRFNMNSKYQLKNNIDLNKGKYTINNDGTVTFSNTAEQWTPIGTNANRFTGELDGNGYKISGLYKNGGSYFGLFGYNDGTIKNLVLDNGYISTGSNSGTFTSRNLANGVINNCTNRINNIIIGSISGGICCANSGTIQNTVNEGNVEFRGQSGGGICASNRNLISNCKNFGNLYAPRLYSNGNYIGGIVGQCSNENETIVIENSYNMGNITVENTGYIIAGIVACCNKNTIVNIKNCYNSGNLTSYSRTSGILELANGATVTIEDCYNKGTIKTTIDDGITISGGIFGWNYSSSTVSIKNSYNVGMLDLVSTSWSGGIAGSSCTTTNCYYLKGTSIGAVKGAANAGATEAESTFMKSAEFENILNENVTKTNWKRVLGKNNGYPVLTVFNDDAGSNFNTLND